jgi:DNA primase
LRFLFLPQGEDPDTYVRKAGKEAFETLMAGAPPLSRFLLDELTRRVDLSAAEGRAGFVHQAKPLLKQMPGNALRVQIVREVAALTRMAPEEVERLCELTPMVAKTRAAGARSPRTAPAPLVTQLLRLLMGNPVVAASISAEQSALLNAEPELAPVAALIELLRTSGATSLGVAFEATRDSEYAEIYAAVVGETLLAAGSDEAVRADLDGVFAQLELRRVQSEYARLSASGVRDETERLRFQELSRRLAELKGASAVNVRSSI